MKQKSINLLTEFLESQFAEYNDFSFSISAIDDYDGFWNFEVTIEDKAEEDLSISLYFKVDYRDESVWVDVGNCEHWEKVEDLSWSSKFFWQQMYFKK